MNICVYAISNRGGGALSVLKDFYNEAVSAQAKYPNVHWFFLVCVPLEETKNITVIRCDYAIKSWFHRLHFNIVTAKEIIKEQQIDAVVSLQNMQILGYKGISIISLHNALPLYKCDYTVLDTKKQRTKQKIVNKKIIDSLKNADAIFVPSEWMKSEIKEKFGINDNKVNVSPLKIPIQVVNRNSKKLNDSFVFFYPAKSYV